MTPPTRHMPVVTAKIGATLRSAIALVAMASVTSTIGAATRPR